MHRQDFPGVRETLERWKIIPRGSPRSAVRRLGIDVEKIIAAGKNPVKACLAFLEIHSEDLIVLAVHQQNGHMRWLAKSLGAQLRGRSRNDTLHSTRCCRVCLTRRCRNLAPEHSHPCDKQAASSAEPGAAARVIRNLQLPAGSVTLRHVGSASDAPSLRLPEVKRVDLGPPGSRRRTDSDHIASRPAASRRSHCDDVRGTQRISRWPAWKHLRTRVTGGALSGIKLPVGSLLG
jgi:hypothetical protein